LGNKFGLDGSNALENYEIDSVAETVGELRLSEFFWKYFLKHFFLYKFTEIAMWYYGVKVKNERYEKLVNEVIPFYLGKLEEQAKNNDGHLAIKKITWVDVYSAAILEYCNVLMDTNLVEGYPNLKKVYEKIMSADGIKKYLEKRPDDKIPAFKI
jgi:hypothetical protein